MYISTFVASRTVIQSSNMLFVHSKTVPYSLVELPLRINCVAMSLETNCIFLRSVVVLLRTCPLFISSVVCVSNLIFCVYPLKYVCLTVLSCTFAQLSWQHPRPLYFYTVEFVFWYFCHVWIAIVLLFCSGLGCVIL